MPTPVSAARQCLTPEAAAALDDAVAVARRRGHGQTTSLHMISSLLSLPSSSLREACARARQGAGAYSARVQFKALELSLTVSLDRLPSISYNRTEIGPPVSNSLMAAIKRSQANQRRQPENYTFYHQQQMQQKQLHQSCSSSIPVVKVELQNLVVSILDDPLVSRVFGEAGFRNFDIKMALLRKGAGGFYTPQVGGCTSRYKRPNPPLFLCNFPFVGCFPGDDENMRRIFEIMRREKKRCPLLVGVSAGHALKMLLEKMSKGLGFSDGLFSGLRVVCIKDEIFRCLNVDFDDGPLRLKVEEVEKMVEGCKVVVNFGDLNELGVDSDENVDGVRILVKRLGKLVEVYGGKLWVTGAAASYEVYFKVLKKFPTIEDDWDLEILPITSFKFSVGGTYPRSSYYNLDMFPLSVVVLLIKWQPVWMLFNVSLMESFVPLGGFFSMPPETKSPLRNDCRDLARCHLCNEKYEQEVAGLSNAEQYHQSSLPSWLNPAEPSPQSSSPSSKGEDDSLLLNAKITALGKKWDDICRQHHFGQTFLKGYQYTHFPGKRENETNNGCNSSTRSPNSSSKGIGSLDIHSKPDKNLNTLPKNSEIPAEAEGINDSFNAGTNDVLQRSPSSVTSVTTDLGLGIISNCPSQPSSFYHDPRDPKSIYKALVERICYQEEAISAIVETISKKPQMGPRNVWIHIRGPDKLGKKKLGLALAEILYGSRECLVYADLSFQNVSTRVETLFHEKLPNKYELRMRGITVIDFLVEKLSKKPSVVFLENIDKADLVVQNSLLEAVKEGRLTDLKGREITISNCIFIASSQTARNGKEELNKYSEKDILNAEGSLLRMIIGFDLNEDPTKQNPVFLNKRRPIGENTILDYRERARKASKSSLDQLGLDLNLPADDGGEKLDISSGNSESDSGFSESSTTWVEDFEGLIDRTVVFRAVDFDGLSERVSEEINSYLRFAGGFGCSVEIETNVMCQILAGRYLFGNKRVEDWIKNVVRRAFSEVVGKFGTSACSFLKIVGCEGASCEELLPGRIFAG
ncbi:double Clp-N motif-containing P-loop nucleosidetriphosphate hydrolases superfamily protein [Striga asiatica]|uniref:Double Clp-N motif-containing P-loop nucleosidetriphosphate hydrolases superfamily protein n=1 Tax=Striga asiatica TaxID=4170 RepID=A0A5A7R0S4_STRAF|nr:double Clp-N motif-containing P-loop nucleosidetriphosphate hydrolases superfamily protein [Striga asiatica]